MALSLTPPVPSATAEPDTAHAHRPSLLAVIRRVSLSLLIAVVIPAVVFYVCFVVAGIWPAIFAALVWAYGAIAWRAVTGRRTSGLLILAALLLTGRTALSFIADSTWSRVGVSGSPAVDSGASAGR